MMEVMVIGQEIIVKFVVQIIMILHYGNRCKVYCNIDLTNGNYLSCNNGECDEITGECVCNEDTNTSYFTKSVNSLKEHVIYKSY